MPTVIGAKHDKYYTTFLPWKIYCFKHFTSWFWKIKQFHFNISSFFQTKFRSMNTRLTILVLSLNRCQFCLNYLLLTCVFFVHLAHFCLKNAAFYAFLKVLPLNLISRKPCLGHTTAPKQPKNSILWNSPHRSVIRF